MSWLEEMLAVFGGSGGPSADDQEFRENSITAYTTAWLERRSTGNDSVELLTDQLDSYAAFKGEDGSPDYPQILIDSWHDDLNPATVKKLIVEY